MPIDYKSIREYFEVHARTFLPGVCEPELGKVYAVSTKDGHYLGIFKAGKSVTDLASHPALYWERVPCVGGWLMMQEGDRFLEW